MTTLRIPRDKLYVALILAALGETTWTIFVGWKLPRHYIANHWDAAWVGIDFAQITLLLLCAWAAWRRRALLILFTAVTGTLLLIDAWFDLTTARKGDVAQSFWQAVLFEIPSAIVMFWTSKRTIHRLAHDMFASDELANLPVRKIPLGPHRPN